MLHNIIKSYHGVEQPWNGEVTGIFNLNKLCIIMAKHAVLIQWQTFKILHNIIKSYHGDGERWRGEVTSTFTLNKLCILMAKRAVLIKWQTLIF